MKRETKNGEQIEIKDMDSDHIARCITAIQKKGYKWRAEMEQHLLEELKRRGEEKKYIFPVIQKRELPTISEI